MVNDVKLMNVELFVCARCCVVNDVKLMNVELFVCVQGAVW